MEEIKRNELVHKFPGMSDDDFMSEIDRTGGWENGYKFCAFFHASEYSGRVCKFTNNGHNSEWWTVICKADDYYWWKLSEEKKQDLVKIAKRQLIDQIQRAV